MSKFTESHVRSLTKAIIYRILVTISIALLVLAAGATAAQTGIVILAVIFIGFAVYYIHERLWLLTFWNRTATAEDSTSRSIIKTITYRAIIIVVAFVTFKIVLGQDNATSFEMALIQAVVNMGWFFIVERIFNRISWGKVPVVDSAEQPAVPA
jgi:uncharacterized membrane protein